MTDQAKRLLEELMSPYEGTAKDFRGPDVCKDFLVDFCPNLLFTNTKADMGSCNLVHDERLKANYQASSQKGKLGYEENFIYRLQNVLGDLEKKIRKAFDRITTEADEKLINPDKDENQEKVVFLEEKIKLLLENIERAGEDGRVDEAQNLTTEKVDSVNPMFKNEKRLEVCDVCGAFLVPDDDTRRLDAHIEGKQHQGYLKIRETLEAYKKNKGKGFDLSRHSPGRHNSYSNGQRRRSRSRSKPRSRSRTRSDSKSGSRSGYKSSSRHYRGERRYRDRDRERSRSTSHDRYRGSRRDRY